MRLSQSAIEDIDTIWLYLYQREGVEVADRIVTEIFKTFYELANLPGLGHRRTDLTNRNVLFYMVFSFLIIYQPQSKPLQILGVLHGKRNVAQMLKQREDPK